MKQKINWRSFVSVYNGYSLIMMLITGIVLYIAPPGRIAHWSDWKFLGFTKSEWQALHTLFSFIWVVAAIYHIIYNWKPLLNYIRRRSKKGIEIRREFILATLATVIIFIGTYENVPPFSYVMDLGEYVTDSWADETNEPPIPHAELLSVSEFARTIKMPLNEMIKTLKTNGYTVPDTGLTMEELADVNKTTPNKIYLLLKVDKALENVPSAKTKFVPGSGFGRKMLSEILKENNISWETAVQKLKEKGIELEKDDQLKNIAKDNDITPLELIKALGLM